MGLCFDCLVEIDDVPNLQACMTRVREGMRIRSMSGKARLA
jgi:D-hydroxyproline dehydrogenase subunit gamma